MTRDQLKLTRMAKTMTQQQIADILYIDKSNVSRILSGERQLSRQAKAFLDIYFDKNKK